MRVKRSLKTPGVFNNVTFEKINGIILMEFPLSSTYLSSTYEINVYAWLKEISFDRAA
jgi:hypothetical protein